MTTVKDENSQITRKTKHVSHNQFGRRIFTEDQIDRIALIYGLQSAGFDRESLKRYFGTKDIELQKSLLATQKRQLWQEITARQKSIDFIERQEDLVNSSN